MAMGIFTICFSAVGFLVCIVFVCKEIADSKNPLELAAGLLLGGGTIAIAILCMIGVVYRVLETLG